ncbi:hypothetical protein D3C80_2217430 [compost metagenome]
MVLQVTDTVTENVVCALGVLTVDLTEGFFAVVIKVRIDTLKERDTFRPHRLDWRARHP